MVSSTWKGILLGACAVVALATVLAVGSPHFASYDRRSEWFFLVCFIAMLPGIAVGGALGRLADRFAARRPAWRRITLTSTGGGAALVLCGLSSPRFTIVAVPIACAMALALERWTRPQPAAERALTAAWRGAIIGLANVVAVAIAIGCLVRFGWRPTELPDELRWLSREPPGLFVLCALFVGLVPGLVSGAALGWLAGRLADQSPHNRVVLLGAGACSVVLAFAYATSTVALAAPALVPTCIAVVLLERATRRRPVLPSARVV